MSNDLQTRDKRNQAVDSSEQYAINIIGDRALQSANLVVKENKRAVVKAVGGKPALPRPNSKQNGRPSTPRQAPTVESTPANNKVHTPAESVTFPSKEKPVAEKAPTPANSKSQRRSTAQKAPHHRKDSPHMQATDNNLHLSEESSLTTWENSAITNSLQNQGAALNTAETSGAALL